MAVFDARPILAAGGEPFEEIMATVAGLAPEEEFVLLAPFEPVPLEAVLASHGYTYEAKPLASDDWEVIFRPAP